MSGWGPFDLTGKSAVVTGGAMGIGFGIANRLVEAGANVLIADLNEDKAAQAAGRLGSAAAYIAADVSSDDVGNKIVAACIERFGTVDIFVNNAGIYPMAPVMEAAAELFDRVYRINVRGLVVCSKAAAAQMIKQGGGGKIINIASIDSFHPSAIGLAAYDSSKGAVLMFTKNFALEMGAYGINVNGIAPGGITTEGSSKPLEGLSDEQQKAMTAAFLKMIPLGRMGVPDDIGKAAVFLASSAADYMTGETIIVDGGRLLM